MANTKNPFTTTPQKNLKPTHSQKNSKYYGENEWEQQIRRTVKCCQIPKFSDEIKMTMFGIIKEKKKKLNNVRQEQ